MWSLFARLTLTSPFILGQAFHRCTLLSVLVFSSAWFPLSGRPAGLQTRLGRVGVPVMLDQTKTTLRLSPIGTGDFSTEFRSNGRQTHLQPGATAHGSSCVMLTREKKHCETFWCSIYHGTGVCSKTSAPKSSRKSANIPVRGRNMGDQKRTKGDGWFQLRKIQFLTLKTCFSIKRAWWGYLLITRETKVMKPNWVDWIKSWSWTIRCLIKYITRFVWAKQKHFNTFPRKWVFLYLNRNS